MHEAIYRCINEACGRPTPRPVKFCPWCGTAQAGAPASRAPAPAGVTAHGTATATATTMATTTAGRDAAAPVVAAAAATAAATAATRTAAAPAAAPQPVMRPPAVPSATDFGRSGKSDAAPGTAPPGEPPRQAQFQDVPRPPLEARPAGRTPIRLRWWLVALVLLWGVWLLARPTSKKIERQIDQAVALARECKGGEAQAELIALRKSRATSEQLERLQQALNDEAAKCTRRRQRAKAWNEASGAVEAALAASSWDKARARLQAFTRRWGEDDDTRALQARVEDLRREDAVHRTHPLAAPPGAPGTPSNAMGSGAPQPDGGMGDPTQSARNLIESARRDLARGDFGAAADKMTLCLTMVDAGNRDCRTLKAQAEQEGKFQ